MTVQEAIQSISIDTFQDTRPYPTVEFQIILDNPAESKPYLYEALDRGIREGSDLPDEYILPFYALPLLAAMRDTDSFERILTVANLPEEDSDPILGDFATEGLDSFLYSTYNGKKELFKQSLKHSESCGYARSSMLRCVLQLCEDGKIERDWCLKLLRTIAESELDHDDFLYTAVAADICKFHYWELLPCVRRLFEEDKIDPQMCGNYDSYVDMMFDYRSVHKRCGYYSMKEFRQWAMWEQEWLPNQSEKEADKDFDFKDLLKDSPYSQMPVTKRKLGRNDACPCGSGKKYKKCCLQKMNGDAEWMESEDVQQHWLKKYPELSPTVKEPNHLYLEDFFDAESIEIDRLVYLALKHRSIPIFVKQDKHAVSGRQRAYLYSAFQKFVEKMKKEGLQTCAEYDVKYSIHYPSSVWLARLSEFLHELGDSVRVAQVKAWVK